MTRTQTVTVSVLVAVTVALIAFDVWASLQHQSGTISEVIRIAAYSHPAIAYGLGAANGLLVGHWFWGKTPAEAAAEDAKNR